MPGPSGCIKDDEKDMSEASECSTVPGQEYMGKMNGRWCAVQIVCVVRREKPTRKTELRRLFSEQHDIRITFYKAPSGRRKIQAQHSCHPDSSTGVREERSSDWLPRH